MKSQNNSINTILRVASPFIGVLLGLLFGAVLILIAGKDPIEAYRQMFLGAFGGQRQITETLLKTCPYLLIGLGLATSFRARIWNIGAEGQYYMGALFGGIVGLYCYQTLPKWLLLTCMMLAAIAGGAFWALIPAIFKIKKGMNEIISTLMLNYIATLLMQYLVRGPLREPGSALPRAVFCPADHYPAGHQTDSDHFLLPDPAGCSQKDHPEDLRV